MPSTSEIVAGLARIADSGFALAVVWHALTALAIGALALGWRPSFRTAALLSCLPLASVSAVAFSFGNPFNGVVFAALAFALALIASAGKPQPAIAITRSVWAGAIGTMLVGLAWVYPHFLEAHSTLAYLIAAPMGLIPCLTLMLVTGFALLGGGGGHRLWTGVLAAAAFTYGAIGVFRLGVWLDLALVAGALALGVSAFERRLAQTRTLI